MLDRVAVRSMMRDVGTMSMGRAERALLASPREDHLGVGTHQRDRNLGTPRELALHDGPGGITTVLGLLDLFLPERIEQTQTLDGGTPCAKDREGRREKQRPRSLHVSGMLPDLGIVAMLLEVTRTIGEGVISVSPRIDDGEVDRLGVGATREVFYGHIDFATISKSVKSV